ncbi:hypothetical protein [Bifidobacterium samirii]|uniref:Uncharacterized protein n=1 Tax=Bifidobacterium samirii TaxID=2306974 RepID=A0A430FVT6_9BIFI|nr:hypothetical protein [Bifidobacterium samirii]RSX58063.1 hypothetical protein D2E24_0423 [Bifidobacterium samirii]
MNLRNEYETARMDIVRFGAADVVRTSGGTDVDMSDADTDLSFFDVFGN